jgi:phage tail-like protein
MQGIAGGAAQAVADVATAALGDEYPPSAFYFKLAFSATGGISDTSFQEVSGIESELKTEEYVELGENRYVHKLPTGESHPNLVLKRGIAPLTSPLVIWCRSVFEGSFAVPIVPMPVVVMLMNENKIPIRTWSFANAYPVKWSIDSFNSTKNEVAIETIELSYNYSNRMV